MKNFPIVFFTLFINYIFVAGESADKKEVLNAFTEVYDMMYAIRDDHAAQIKELMEKDMEKTKKIEHLEYSDEKSWNFIIKLNEEMLTLCLRWIKENADVCS